MSSSLNIEATDASGRWYLLPGSENAFDLKITNGADHSVLCKFSLDDPAGAGTVSPATATLKAGESRTVSVAFKPDWLSLRDRKAVISARNAAGTVLASFVHDLVATTTTDCSVSLAWKDEIASEGALRGFVLSCAVRSISSTPGVFEPEFAPHPSLRFPEKQRLTLGPGESATFDVPVIWNRSARDNEGWNHPRTIEVGVPVTHGRRAASAPWDIVQQHIEPYVTDSDKAPVLARRPPPPQFTTPGGGAPAVSAMPIAAPPQPTLVATVTESPSARIARAELEAGVAGPGIAAPGMRLPPPVTAAPTTVDRRIISVAPATLWLIGMGFVAIFIVLLFALRAPIPSAVSTAPVVVASPVLSSVTPAPHGRRTAAHAKTTKPKGGASPAAASAATTVAPAQAVAASAETATAAPHAGGGSASSHTAHAQPVHRSAPPARMSAVDRGALVQLDGVGAEYMRGGRLVRVYWDSYAQVRADVQLLDDDSRILAETVVGRREGALLWLPRGYNGSVYVQVTAFDFNGERVVSSTSLGPP